MAVNATELAAQAPSRVSDAGERGLVRLETTTSVEAAPKSAPLMPQMTMPGKTIAATLGGWVATSQRLS